MSGDDILDEANDGYARPLVTLRMMKYARQSRLRERQRLAKNLEHAERLKQAEDAAK